MSAVAVNNIRIEYEAQGDPSDPPLLLIMGYSAQLTFWPASFCDRLVSRGCRIVRFDNRDSGLSTHFHGQRAPGLWRALWAHFRGRSLETPYSLDDMAQDALGLLDALGIHSAHMVGVSMGGMIAQLLAAKHPDRVRSLTSMMSTSGHPSLPRPKARVLGHILLKHRKSMQRQDMIDFLVKLWELQESPAYPTAAQERQRLVTAWVDRSFDPVADGRQFAAMAAAGDRSELLRSIQAPTLVIHGADDPLITVEAGEHTAAMVPGAQLEVIPGMGHDFPEALTVKLADLIVAHVHRAEHPADQAGRRSRQNR